MALQLELFIFTRMGWTALGNDKKKDDIKKMNQWLIAHSFWGPHLILSNSFGLLKSPQKLYSLGLHCLPSLRLLL